MNIVKCVIDEIPEVIYNVVEEFGVPSHIGGYDYIAYAVYLLVDNPCRNLRMLDDIYPTVAREFNKKKNSVERSIRHAVAYAFNNTDPDILEKYFGNSISIESGRVNNSQFLYTMSRVARRRLIELNE